MFPKRLVDIVLEPRWVAELEGRDPPSRDMSQELLEQRQVLLEVGRELK
jgi:hypothetical protein